MPWLTCSTLGADSAQNEVRKGLGMVKNGHSRIEPVPYQAPAAEDALEVLSMHELARRMERAGVRRRTERPNFHLLLRVQRGQLIHTVDFRAYAVDAGAWLWVRPGQVQRFEALDAVEGAVVLFQQDYLDRATVTDTHLDDSQGRIRWPVADDAAHAVDLALEHLSQEFGRPSGTDATRRAILRHLLAVLLLRLTDPHDQLGSRIEDHGEPFRAFRQAVENQFTLHREVGYYARTLGYSPRTLRRATLAAAGMGAKEFIDQRVILEAKRLLAHEDDAVGRVAARLGFFDASNFVKYFAQRTGHTPAAFRTTHRGTTS